MHVADTERLILPIVTLSDPYGDPVRDEKAVKSELSVEKQDMTTGR